MRLTTYRYRLPLMTTLWEEEREGVILKLENGKGHIGYGEIAPLRGRSRESLEEALKHLEERDSTNYLYPSVSFGLEMARKNLLAAERGVALRYLFTDKPLERLLVNDLLDARDPHLLEKISPDQSCYKVKVGNQPLEQDIHALNLLTEAHRGKLRVDVNKHWDLKTAISFGREIDSKKIEYVEEPVESITEIREFFEATGLPVALDEAVSEMRDIPFLKGVSTVIIKPTLLGGFDRAKKLAEAAVKQGYFVVVTSTLESGIGLLALANFASAIHAETLHAGLSTFSCFEEDLLTKPLALKEGAFLLEELDQFVIDEKKLESYPCSLVKQ